MLYLIILIIFIMFFAFIYNTFFLLNRDKISVSQRVQRVHDMNEYETQEEINDTFSQRTIKPIYTIISQVLIKLTPNHKIKALSKKLESAGLLKNGTVEKFLYKSSMLVLIISGLIGLMTYLIEPNIIKALLLAILTAVCVNVILRFFLSSTIEKRKLKIIKDLPFTLDLITVSVEAGLSFDGAIARVINNISGELSDEFAKTLKETKMGIERKVALKNMSERCDIKELSMFITSLIQADSLGVSLGNVLRIESAQMRERRKQTAREKAMKAPVKMLFPLIIFIFPAIFVIILGPAAIKIFQMFMG